MRNLILILLLLVTSLSVSAQTQTGFVKTRGRLDSNGNTIPGQRISGATVQVKGRNAVVTDANGAFSFPVPAKRFTVQSVKKQGYVLADPDAIAIQYTYSPNPLIFVLETRSRLNSDKQTPERIIRSNLKSQLRSSSRERAVKVIGRKNTSSPSESTGMSDERSSQQHYIKRLYIKWESYDQLISDLAERYSQIDYDQINEFNRRVSFCILNGRLAEADSLLHSKGDIKDRINSLHQEEVTAMNDSSELFQYHDNWELIETSLKTAKEDIAIDCYHLYERFFLEQKYDSAAYYLELRASLDTTNLEWLNDAGSFLADKVRGYFNRNHPLSYFEKGLRLAKERYGDQSEWTATFHFNIGIIYYNLYFDICNSFSTSKEVYDEIFNNSIIHLLQANIISEDLLGPDNPLTQKTRKDLEFVNQQYNKWKGEQNN